MGALIHEILPVGMLQCNCSIFGDETTHQAMVIDPGDEIDRILEVLARSAGRTVTRDELTAALYQRRATPYERSLDVHISHLRKKLERDERSLIRTIRGVGYQFAP